jgi:hypothetical protein
MSNSIHIPTKRRPHVRRAVQASDDDNGRLIFFDLSLLTNLQQLNDSEQRAALLSMVTLSFGPRRRC